MREGEETRIVRVRNSHVKFINDATIDTIDGFTLRQHCLQKAQIVIIMIANGPRGNFKPEIIRCAETPGAVIIGA